MADVADGDQVLDGDLAGGGIDRHLHPDGADLPERGQHLGGAVTADHAHADHLASVGAEPLPDHLGRGQRLAVDIDPAVVDLGAVEGDAGRLGRLGSQVVPQVGAGCLHGQADHGGGAAGAGGPLEGREPGVALADGHRLHRHAELPGRDLGQRGAAALTHLGAAHQQRDRPVGVHADLGGGDRRRAGVAGGHGHPPTPESAAAGVEAGICGRGRSGISGTDPAGHISGCVHAAGGGAFERGDDGVEVGDQVGVERALAVDDRVARGEQVATPQLDGVDAEPLGGHVHVQLPGQRTLGRAETPVRRRRGGVGVHRGPPHPQVGHPVGAEAAVDALGEHQRAVVGVGAGVETDLDVAGADAGAGVEAGAHRDDGTVGPGGVHGPLDVGGDLDGPSRGP